MGKIGRGSRRAIGGWDEPLLPQSWMRADWRRKRRRCQDFIRPGEYDLAGFIVGIVERKKILTGKAVKPRRHTSGIAVGGIAYQRIFAGPKTDL